MNNNIEAKEMAEVREEYIEEIALEDSAESQVEQKQSLEMKVSKIFTIFFSILINAFLNIVYFRVNIFWSK